MRNSILSMTNNDDIIILIGHTPSYLKIFLEKERNVFNLPFSGKAYWIINRNGEIDDSYCKMNNTTLNNDINNNDINNKYLMSDEYRNYLEQFDKFSNDKSQEEKKNIYINYKWPSYMPTLEGEKQYFTYLNTKTFLTKQFVKNNWNKLILIDYSSGRTIHGVSVFFNRYVGKVIGDIPKNVCNIDNAQPLKFINIGHRTKFRVNIDPDIYINYNIDEKYINLNPELIILLGDIPFLHLEQFIIEESFPRYVTEYSTAYWIIHPNDRQFLDNMGNNGIDYINRLRKIFRLYEKLINIDNNVNKDNNNFDKIKVGNAMKLFNIIKDTKFVSDYIDNRNINKNNIVDELHKLFRYFSNIVLMEKCVLK